MSAWSRARAQRSVYREIGRLTGLRMRTVIALFAAGWVYNHSNEKWEKK